MLHLELPAEVRKSIRERREDDVEGDDERGRLHASRRHLHRVPHRQGAPDVPRGFLSRLIDSLNIIITLLDLLKYLAEFLSS